MTKMTIADGFDEWENELYFSVRRRARLAWSLVVILLVVVGLMAAAIAMLTPLKSIEPIVITVDRNTGLANVESMLGTVTLDDDVAVTQSLIYQYVRDRETYDAQDVKERMNAVFRRTQAPSRNELRTLYTLDNPNNPMNVYGSRERVQVKIRSVILNPGDRAQVRLVKTVLNSSGEAVATRNYVAVLTYGYDREGSMSLEERWSNPLGFFVSRYRIDQEAG